MPAQLFDDVLKRRLLVTLNMTRVTRDLPVFRLDVININYDSSLPRHYPVIPMNSPACHTDSAVFERTCSDVSCTVIAR